MTTVCTGVLQIAVRGAGGGDRFSPVGRRSEILMGGGIYNFLPHEGNLRRSDFDDSNLFQS